MLSRDTPSLATHIFPVCRPSAPSLLAASERSALPEGTKAAMGKVALLTLRAGSWDGGPDFL
jgi:hypothetical protein